MNEVSNHTTVVGHETNLFNLGEIVLGVLVEHELPNRAKRVFSVRPNFGEVEDVEPPSAQFSEQSGERGRTGLHEALGLVRGEDLSVDGPARVVAFLDSLEQILGCEVGVRP